MKDYEKLLPIFRTWFKHQFGEEVKVKFDECKGFLDEDINTLWIGFCGGWLVRDAKS